MANTLRARRSTRFSLLLLQDSEVLLSDLAVNYHFVPDTTIESASHTLDSYSQRLVTQLANVAARGRVKLGTHSISFDSDDWRDPIVRIPLISVENARPTRDNLRSRDSDSCNSPDFCVSRPTKVKTDEAKSVLIVANTAVFQRELGVDHPYIDVCARGRHIFTPLYSTVVTLLGDITTLLRITTVTNARRRNALLRELVQQREARVPFDLTLLEHGATETTLMDTAAAAVYTIARQPGRLCITRHNIYFMPIHSESTLVAERVPVRRINGIRRLRHGCRDAALEISYLADEDSLPCQPSASLMLTFLSRQVRARALKMLCSVILRPITSHDRHELNNALNKWRIGTMSNFDYLLFLNLAAGRSFNDLSQYPVFPWVIKDYTSSHLDLDADSTFRDLSKPIGALNNDRLDSFLERYREMPPPAFLYGTHYSTPAYVIYYLVRAAPGAMLRLQNGRFDTPDRLFHSIASTWESVLHNRGDVKELIPEFYSLNFGSIVSSGIVPSSADAGGFLDNVMGLDLGVRQDGIRVDDVELPPWANGSSQLFVRKMREALECDHVSTHLHFWIDLIFGVKSRNADAYNLFYTDVTLPESIQLDKERQLDENEMTQIETMYLEFGRTPNQLFRHPHPPRFGDLKNISFDDSSMQEAIAAVAAERSGNDLIAKKWFDEDNTINDGAVELQLMESSDQITEENESKTSLPSCKTVSQNSHLKDSRSKSKRCRNRSRILSHFQDPKEREGDENVARFSQPSLSHIINHDEHSHSSTQASILDMCVVDTCDAKGSQEIGKNVEVCTVWDSGYLKIHSASKALRSKVIAGVCAVTYVVDDIVAYGTRTGTIGLYYIDSARDQVTQECAHDGEIRALTFVPARRALVSASQDGSVKVWRFERIEYRDGCLRFSHEVDAEGSVTDMCATCLGRKDRQTILLAAWTLDCTLLAWKLDMNDLQAFSEPIWRRDISVANPQPRIRKRHKSLITWLGNGSNRPALACVQPDQHYMCVWDVEKDIAFAEVYIPTGANCVWAQDGSRTILLGGNEGNVGEFDSTGLCVSQILVENANVIQLDGGRHLRCIAIWDETDRIYLAELKNQDM